MLMEYKQKNVSQTKLSTSRQMRYAKEIATEFKVLLTELPKGLKFDELDMVHDHGFFHNF